jgi:PKD repeat protein
MRALLRPLFVGGLSIAIAATTLVGSSSVALGATRPSITSWSVSGPVYEGDRPFANATFTDIDAGDRHTVDISWGDDTYDTYTLPLGDRSFSVQKTVPYVNETTTPWTVQITVNDPIFSTSRFTTVTVLNAAPSITSFGLSSSDMEAGQAVTATGVFTDGGATDTHTVTFDWGDGSPTATKSLAAGVYSFTSDAYTYAGVGTFTVTAKVTDDAGASATATSSVSVHQPNQAPSVSSFGITAGDEGGSSSLALTFADVDAADTHTVSVAWGDGLTSDSGVLSADVTTFATSHVYADTGTYPVVLTLADNAGHTVTANASVSPTNVAPVVGSLSVSPSSVVDHQTLTVSGAFTDPGTADTFTVTVDWGDLTSWTDSLAAGTRSFSATHAYNAAGPVTIKATVTDRDNGRSSSSVDLVVGSSNHAPANLSLSASAAGANVSLDASFTDADALDTHTVSMSWGDNASAEQDLAAGMTTFTASHVYAASGTYTVSATVSDAATSTSATTQVVVTVPAVTAADVLNDMSGLVLSFDLDRNTERWLLKKIDDTTASLAYGNGQICSSSGTLDHLMAFAQRTLTNDEYAALSGLSTNLQAAAGCNRAQSPKVLKASTVTPKTTVTTVTTKTATPAPAPKKDTTSKDAKADLKATGGHNSR